MAQTPNSYEARFGAEINLIAQRARAQAGGAALQSLGSTKHSRWFFGEENGVPQTAQPVDQVELAKKVNAHVHAEVGKATFRNLNTIGDENFHDFTKKLPAGHKLSKALRPAQVHQAMPHLGCCKIGQVTNGFVNGLKSIEQIFVGNFNAELDTSGKGLPYILKDNKFGEIYYSMHMLVDEKGAFKGFDHSRGEKGVGFITQDMTEAYYAIASAATGFTIEQLRELARASKLRAA